MAKTKIKIEWRDEASIHFYEILEYLEEESEKALSIVGNAILDEIESLIIFPPNIHLTVLRKTMMEISALL